VFGFSTEHTMTFDQIQTLADAKAVLSRVVGANPQGATLSVRRPVSTFKDLLAKLGTMDAQDLSATVTAQFDLKATYLQKPVGQLTHIEFHVGALPEDSRTVLRVTSDELLIPRASDLAHKICDLMQVQFSERDGTWTFTGRDGNCSKHSYADKDIAAQTAVRNFFAKSDWKYEVANDDTHLGYFEWALNLAYELADERSAM
jgi:hypothetical protein